MINNLLGFIMSKIEKIENYYSNGMLREKGVLKDGKVYGKWIYCYESGEKYREINFDKNGKPLNIIKWYKNGQKWLECRDFKDGVESVWYENGQKKYESSIKNTIVHGPFTRWYENGNKQFEGTFKNGIKEGNSILYYENGQKKMEGFVKNDLGVGPHVIWDENGKVIWEGDFLNNKPINDEGFPYSLFPNFNRKPINDEGEPYFPYE